MRKSRTASAAAGRRGERPARSLKARAIEYLSRREYSRSELERKLAPFVGDGSAVAEGVDPFESAAVDPFESADVDSIESDGLESDGLESDGLESYEGETRTTARHRRPSAPEPIATPEELAALLDTLEREGWLSDARFAESVVNRRASRMGANRIVSELRRHAVDDALVESVGAKLRETELSRAQAVWQKKFGQVAQTPAERAKQARFLAMRGFSSSIISKVLKGDDDWLVE
jgi:SOS response regulatory protein OraA/RecX